MLMADISKEALDRALAKVKQLVPNAGRVETIVRRAIHSSAPRSPSPPCFFFLFFSHIFRSVR